jgi:hypothetical protein
LGGFGTSTLTFLYYTAVAPLSAVPNSRNSKTKNFLFLFEKIGRAISKKMYGKFFCFGTEISAKFQGGSGAEAKPNFQKKFELGCKSAPFDRLN